MVGYEGSLLNIATPFRLYHIPGVWVHRPPLFAPATLGSLQEEARTAHAVRSRAAVLVLGL